MDWIIEEILKDDFVEYLKVYELAKLKGMSKKEVKEVKKRLGVKTVNVVDGNDILWLWYIPKKVLNKHLPRK
jgi:hypothetical protein